MGRLIGKRVNAAFGHGCLLASRVVVDQRLAEMRPDGTVEEAKILVGMDSGGEH